MTRNPQNAKAPSEYQRIIQIHLHEGSIVVLAALTPGAPRAGAEAPKPFALIYDSFRCTFTFYLQQLIYFVMIRLFYFKQGSGNARRGQPLSASLLLPA
jgi:hypothetical protein